MLHDAVVNLGPWSWWILGVVLLATELAAPGVFLIWIGAAAIVIGVLSLALWDAAFWTWHVQLLLFAVLSGAFALAGRRFYSSRNQETDEPNLNRRGESLVGRTATLHEPIAEGRGRIRLDDTWWSVMGPDLPAGTQVKVVAASGRDLTVEAA
ncbi:NfeD family protein [Neorhizobium galegae]|uniref:NfeD family protein n=1 Tax=Neorhizobium galegae TaxID=399 RepID=UPI000621E823|nr:NfeD family protein [Neorhizobium galegae]CDZ26126.1 Nodulation protein nfed, c-terminal only [Neorhizobium galegae bv. officinalis]KAA9388241.1 NfeD family protein [Neorhizobium galegae]KAB1109923.1 NfeD family protein [Neorhizobium galegae]MCM2501224.1 NfeD family protein [Neorhizobium galegae]MCQ1770106.1 NfeD family protein [Neorhizobium galegae]